MRTIRLADQDIIRKVTAEHRLPNIDGLAPCKCIAAVRHHAFNTPMNISREQTLWLSTTDYFDEFEPGNVKPAP